VEVLTDGRLWWTYFCPTNIVGTSLSTFSIDISWLSGFAVDCTRFFVFSIHRTCLSIFTIDGGLLRDFSINVISLHHFNIVSRLGTSDIDGGLSQSNLQL